MFHLGQMRMTLGPIDKEALMGLSVFEAMAWRNGVDSKLIADTHNQFLKSSFLNQKIPSLYVSPCRRWPDNILPRIVVWRPIDHQSAWYQRAQAPDEKKLWGAFSRMKYLASPIREACCPDTRYVLVSGLSGSGKTTVLIPALIEELTHHHWQVLEKPALSYKIAEPPLLIHESNVEGVVKKALLVDDPIGYTSIDLPDNLPTSAFDQVIFVDGHPHDVESKLKKMYTMLGCPDNDYLGFLQKTVVADISPNGFNVEQLAAYCSKKYKHVSHQALTTLSALGVFDDYRLLEKLLKTQFDLLARGTFTLDSLFFPDASTCEVGPILQSPTYIGSALLYTLTGGFRIDQEGRPAYL